MITVPPRTWAPSPVAAALASDEELMRRVREGDQRAFEAIYERYREPLHRYCHSIVRQREDAEEAYQATMLSAFQKLSDPEAREVVLRPWLYRIAHNACVSALRRRPIEAHAPLTGLEEAPGRVEERSEVAADLRQLRQDLDQLSDGQRSALVMRELGGLGHEEIGRALGEQAAVAKQLIYTARLALQDLSAGRDMACDGVRRTLSDGDRRILRARSLRAHLRACAGCQRWEEALRLRPARLAALAPALPAAALHELLAGALGATAGGAGLAGSAGAGMAGGLAGAGAAAGAGGTAVGAGMAAKIAIIGSAAMIGGGTAAIPALDQPAREPIRAIAMAPPAAAAAGPTPATPVGGPLGTAVHGTAHADLGPARADREAGGSQESAEEPSGEGAPGRDDDLAEARTDDEGHGSDVDGDEDRIKERSEPDGGGEDGGHPATPSSPNASPAASGAGAGQGPASGEDEAEEDAHGASGSGGPPAGGGSPGPSANASPVAQAAHAAKDDHGQGAGGPPDEEDQEEEPGASENSAAALAAAPGRARRTAEADAPAASGPSANANPNATANPKAAGAAGRPSEQATSAADPPAEVGNAPAAPPGAEKAAGKKPESGRPDLGAPRAS